MNKVEIFYKKVIEAVCKECGTDPVMMFSNNKERNVDARGVAITILADRKLSDNIISDLTGMTRPYVIYMRFFAVLIIMSISLRWTWRQCVIKARRESIKASTGIWSRWLPL